MSLLQKHIKIRYLLFCLSIFFLLLFQQNGYAQNQDPRLVAIQVKLDTLAAQGAPLDELVTISMSGSIQDFVAFLAETTQLNISIEPEVTANVSFTFTDAVVKDVILHICEAYSLEVKLTGNIIRLLQFEKPKPTIQPKKLDINYSGGNLTMSLRRDTLDNVIREISKQSGTNIVVEPIVRNSPVSGFLVNVPMQAALEQLALNNDLSFENRGGFYYLGAFKEDENALTNSKDPKLQTQGISVKKISGDRVQLKAIDAEVLDIIREVAIKLEADYFLLPEVTLNASNSTGRNTRNQNQNQPNNNRPNNQNFNNNRQQNRFNGGGQGGRRVTGNSDNIISIQLQSASFEDVLRAVTRNSDYTYELKNGLATIGTRNAETMRETKVMQLRYRSARDVLAFIPEEVLLNVEIDTLLELNSLVLSGSKHNIDETITFLQRIDQLVPVVTIELIIVDVQTNLLDEFGIEAGSVPGGRTAGGTIIGDGLNFTLSPKSINRVLGALASANIINLGQVSADFFLTLKAIEEKGLIEVQSTPKLSTLNNHPANMSIGQTRYYQIEEVNFPGLDNPIPVQSQRFESIDANLAINITPIVSGDEQVTLEIYFEQSEFVALPPNEPPPTVSRRFDSSIRIRNGEMIVLGGLERESNSKVTRGIPFLSRVPVIGWIFGNKRKEKTKEKLLVFIKPTISY